MFQGGGGGGASGTTTSLDYLTWLIEMIWSGQVIKGGIGCSL